MDPSNKISACASSPQTSLSELFSVLISMLNELRDDIREIKAGQSRLESRSSLLEGSAVTASGNLEVLRPSTAVAQTLPAVVPSVTKRPRRMSMHSRKAAIVRFDARIGASLSSAAVLVTEASVLLATSRPSAAIPFIASETPARAGVVSSNLVRPSDEALRPFDSLFGHLVRIGSFS
jgi:hypothetical protein